jgi:hypothetical protein
MPSEQNHSQQLSLLNGMNENRRVYFRESTVKDNHEEGTRVGRTWTLAYIEHLSAFISGDLNACCQNFACNTAVVCRQHHHNSLLLSQGHAVGQLAATTRTVCLSICALLVSCLQRTCTGAESCDSASKRKCALNSHTFHEWKVKVKFVL